jgi:hypothetical protein
MGEWAGALHRLTSAAGEVVRFQLAIAKVALHQGNVVGAIVGAVPVNDDAHAGWGEG